MSRLTAHKQKEFTQKMVILIGSFVVLSIIFITFGFKILISFSVFLSNVFSKDKTNTTQENSFYGSLDVDNLATATNSASIIVSGSTTNYDTVQFYINSKQVKETKLNNTTNFSEEIGTLQKGQNTIYVKAISTKELQKKQSATQTVTYKADKLKLDISEPQDKQTVHKQDLIIKGETDKEASVQVNGSPVVVDASAHFQTTIKLKDGDNTITIMAQDLAGNQETKTLMVNYQKED